MQDQLEAKLGEVCVWRSLRQATWVLCVPSWFKANPDKIKAIEQIQAPRTVKDVRCLIGCIAALSRFISKSAKRALLFFKILKKARPMKWTLEADATFKFFSYLSSVPTLVAPKPQEPLLL